MDRKVGTAEKRAFTGYRLHSSTSAMSSHLYAVLMTNTLLSNIPNNTTGESQDEFETTTETNARTKLSTYLVATYLSASTSEHFTHLNAMIIAVEQTSCSREITKARLFTGEQLAPFSRSSDAREPCQCHSKTLVDSSLRLETERSYQASSGACSQKRRDLTRPFKGPQD